MLSKFLKKTVKLWDNVTLNKLIGMNGVADSMNILA
jgi:hypothetical protein